MENIELKKEIRSAIKKGDTFKVIELIESNHNLVYEMTAFGTWLHVASDRGNMELVKYFISKGIDINTKGGTFEANALTAAASSGQIEIVKYLLDNGIEMDVSSAVTNPLFSAIYGGYIDIVKELVARGIDISIKYKTEMLGCLDAYEYASQYGQTEIANYLKQLLESRY